MSPPRSSHPAAASRRARWRRRSAVACGLALWAVAPLAAQPAYDPAVVTIAGRGPTTYVLLSGMVGGVGGFRRLETRLRAHGHRVVVIDPYRMSVDSADVTFAALARRVDSVLAQYGVDSAQVVGHAHGAGVALRLAASAPDRVAALHFLDVGALADHRSPVFSASLRLVPLILRLPGGRRFVRSRFVRGLRQNAGRQEWLDPVTERSYTEPLLDGFTRAVAMARRLARANEPEPLSTVVSRVRVPVTVFLGGAPHPAGPEPKELRALEPLGARLRIERFPGIGHFLHEEAPDELAARLLASATPMAATR